MLDVVLSPEVHGFLDRLAQPERSLTRGRLRKLSDPRHFIKTTRPLLGAGPEWRVATVGPFEFTCRLLDEEQSRTARLQHPALIVATVDRSDDLRAQGDELVDEAERELDAEEDDDAD